MNYTQHYQLPQWVDSDRILRTDFNDAYSKLDAALKSNADALSAETAANAAAHAGFGNCRLVYGSYVGSGQAGASAPCSLTFDGKPLAIFIMAQSHNANGWLAFLPMIRGTQWTSANTPCSVTWSENGVTWYHYENSPQYQLSWGTNFYIALLEADE